MVPARYRARLVRALFTVGSRVRAAALVKGASAIVWAPVAACAPASAVPRRADAIEQYEILAQGVRSTSSKAARPGLSALPLSSLARSMS
jgi:hypothetical protein